MLHKTHLQQLADIDYIGLITWLITTNATAAEREWQALEQLSLRDGSQGVASRPLNELAEAVERSIKLTKLDIF